jgi:hypothetical protein
MKRSLFLALPVLTALSATALASTPKLVSGNFKGKTAQHKPISMFVRTKGQCVGIKAPCVTGVSYSARFTCLSPSKAKSKVAGQSNLPAAAIRKNKLKLSFTTPGGSNGSVNATFIGTKVSGAFRETDHLGDGSTCTTGKVTFKVKH